MSAKPHIQACIFDVFGTLVDWRTSIAREAQAALAPLGVALNWHAFADAWRDQYQPAMEDVRAGRLPFSKLDVLHRRNLDVVLAAFDLQRVRSGQQGWTRIDELHRQILDDILPRFGLAHLDEAARAHLNRVWHRLDAWPDVAAGLLALRQKCLLAPCSNGNISLMVDLARRNGFAWDAILGAEVARAYKPTPIVYTASAAALDVPPENTLMVAAHSDDLAAAAAAGLRTAFVARPDEFGPGRGEATPACAVDYCVNSILELADLL